MEKNCININGLWTYILDPKNKFKYDFIIKEFINNESLPEMDIPNNWELAGLNNYNGAVWFITEITIPDKYKNFSLPILKFNGVDYFTDVWLNDVKIGFHEGYFQEFYYNIQNILKYGETNILIAKVNSPKEEPEKVWPLKKQLIKGIFNHHDCRPGGWSYEFGQDKNTGGIWNDVKLIFNNGVYIEQVKITSAPIENNSYARTTILLSYISNIKGSLEAELKITITKDNNNVIEFNTKTNIQYGSGEILLTFDMQNPELWNTWDAGYPNLYKAVVKSKYFNTIETFFGIRTISLDDKQNFYLNGKNLFLRGTNIIPTQFLSSFDNNKIKTLVKLIKEANINVVRIHAHVNRKELYDEFDRQGILLWQDFALQWTYDESVDFVGNAVAQIKDMVKQNYNHPSIAFWCCHNEPGEQIKTLDPFLYQAVLSEDSSRIIRMASNYEEHPYDGWYWGNKEHYAAAPMGPLVTEFGAQAIPCLTTLKRFMTDEEINTPDWKKWEYHNYQYEQTSFIANINMGKNISDYINNSQQYQSDLLITAIENYRRKKNNGITGIFQFMFIDCWESITWSIVDYYGECKNGYYALQKMYEPVLLSLRVRQNKYLANSFLNIDMWVINDLHEEYNNSSILFMHNGKTIFEIDNFNLPANGVIFINWETLKTPISDHFTTGEHVLYVSFINNGRIVAKTDFTITVIENKNIY
ncbi:MAG: glycoside hydrolase family 2 TIM barrel-domain containing protein [bacterium]